MTPSEKFYRTLFTGQAAVCGQSLPRLTLWRLASLEAIQSPFVSTDTETTVTPLHLVQAITALHCEFPNPPDMRLTKDAAERVRAMQNNPGLWLQEAKSFMAYLREYSLRPEMWESSINEARNLTAPPLLAQVVALMRLGIPHKEAWDTSPGYAAWLIMASAERDCDKVAFFRDDDLIEPEPSNESEEAIRAMAKAAMGEEQYRQWLAAREVKNG